MKVYTLSELARRCGVRNATVTQWIGGGIYGVRLEYDVVNEYADCIKPGCAKYVTEAQLKAFLKAVAEARRPKPKDVPPQFRREQVQTKKQRRQSEAVSRTLGVKR